MQRAFSFASPALPTCFILPNPYGRSFGNKASSTKQEKGALERLGWLQKLGALANVGFLSKLDFLSSGRAPTVSIDSFSAGESVKR